MSVHVYYDVSLGFIHVHKSSRVNVWYFMNLWTYVSPHRRTHFRPDYIHYVDVGARFSHYSWWNALPSTNGERMSRRENEKRSMCYYSLMKCISRKTLHTVSTMTLVKSPWLNLVKSTSIYWISKTLVNDDECAEEPANKKNQINPLLKISTNITNHASRLIFRNDPEIKWPPQSMYYM